MDRRLRYGLIAAAALLGLVLAAPALIPATFLRARIEQAAAHALGRQVVIAGPIHVALLPEPGLTVRDVRLARPGKEAPWLATAREVRVSIDPWPLLFGRLEVTSIDLDRPEANLRIDKDGRANWVMPRAAERRGGARPRRGAPNRLPVLRVVEGRIVFGNDRSGRVRTIDNLNFRLDATSPNGPAELAGTVGSEQPLAFAARADRLESLVSDRTATVVVIVGGETVQAKLTGALRPGRTFAGRIALRTPSVRHLARLLGVQLPENGGLGVFAASGSLNVSESGARLEAMVFSLDGAHGSVSAELADRRRTGTQPAGIVSRVALAIDHLDLNPYLEKTPGTGNRHRHRGDGWSRRPIAVDFLRDLDCELDLSAGSLALRKLRLGRTHLHGSAHADRADLAADGIALYGGRGDAELSIVVNGPEPTYTLRARLNDVTLEPFLTDLLGVRNLQGRGTMALDLSARGSSTDGLMHDLNGTGSIAAADGRIVGVDLGAVARTVRTFLGMSTNPDALTKFDVLSGSFSAAGGVLSTADLRMTGPLLNMGGSGRVDLGRRAIDFRFTPSVTAEIARHKLAIGVPFRAKGPWRHIRYTPDLAGLWNGVLDNLSSGKAPFKGLFGTPDAPKKPPAKKHKSAIDALKNMLGIH